MIEENLNLKENTFLQRLNDYGDFCINDYNDLVIYIVKLNDSKIDDLKRLEISNKVWELSYLISNYLCNAQNKDDIYEIQNLNEILDLDIKNKLYYVANFFSYNKKIDLSFALLLK